MISNRLGLLLALLVIVSSLLQLCDALTATTTKAHSHKKHHRRGHHHDDDAEEEEEMPVPPPEFLEAMLRRPPADFPRFHQLRVGDAPTGGNADIVSSVYGFLAAKRDSNQEEATKVVQAKEFAQKHGDELAKKAKDLEDRSSMLTRLQFCLEQDAQNKLVDPLVNTTGSNQDSQLLQQQKDELTKVAQELQRRKTELEINEKEIQRKLDMIHKRDQDLQAQATAIQEQKMKFAADQLSRSNALSMGCLSTCNAETTCSGCVEHSNCGWCRSSQSCIDVTNPAAPSNCSLDDFNYLFCRQETCNQHRNCHACVADPQCGLCVTNNQCAPGTLTGPASGTCGNWFFANSLVFLSLNIYGRDVASASARASNILGLIKQSNADFVALQEVEDWFLEALSQQDWSRNYYASDFGSGHAPGGLLILSKYPIAHVAYQEKTEPGQVEVDQRGRILSVRPKYGNNRLVVTNTHLDWRQANSRADSLDFIFSLVNSTSDAVIMGDFNFDEGAVPESDRIPRNVRDVWTALRNNHTGFTWDPIHNEYARNTDPSSRPSRIDRIFVKSDFWYPSKIIKVGNDKVSPHFGLLATMQFFNAFC